MKIKTTIILLFIALSAKAKFIEAKILFNDGHTESGFVKSFLEDKFIDLGMFQKLETRLNMNDADLKFKSDANAEIRTISIDDVNELTLVYKNGATESFKVLYLRSLDSRGKIKNSDYKMWFPLVKKGKINVYGYRYREATPSSTGGMSLNNEFIYYFQNSKKDYAMSPLADVTLASAMNGGAQKGIENCFNDLLSDCPEYATQSIKTMSKQEKIATYKDYKNGLKKRKKAAKSQNYSSVREYYEIYYYQISDALALYETNCPN